MYITLALHHPKGSVERLILMQQMPKLAEEGSKHKGFVQTVVAGSSPVTTQIYPGR